MDHISSNFLTCTSDAREGGQVGRWKGPYIQADDKHNNEPYNRSSYATYDTPYDKSYLMTYDGPYLKTYDKRDDIRSTTNAFEGGAGGASGTSNWYSK